jgi:hypothetical protein
VIAGSFCFTSTSQLGTKSETARELAYRPYTV